MFLSVPISLSAACILLQSYFNCVCVYLYSSWYIYIVFVLCFRNFININLSNLDNNPIILVLLFIIPILQVREQREGTVTWQGSYEMAGLGAETTGGLQSTFMLNHYTDQHTNQHTDLDSSQHGNCRQICI